MLYQKADRYRVVGDANTTTNSVMQFLLIDLSMKRFVRFKGTRQALSCYLSLVDVWLLSETAQSQSSGELVADPVTAARFNDGLLVLTIHVPRGRCVQRLGHQTDVEGGKGRS